MKHEIMSEGWERFSQVLSALEQEGADNKGPLKISPEVKRALLDLKQLKSYQNVSILGYGPSGHPLDLREGFVYR
ncbi:MAG: hypothetical protein ABIM32_03585 [candidate division WOR-3 bacterium]